jgi:hypothetical protein
MPRFYHQTKLELSNFSGKRERQKRQVASALNRGGKLTLVLCAGSRLATWADFAIFGYEAAQEIALFIINYGILIGAELADLRAGDIAPE